MPPRIALTLIRATVLSKPLKGCSQLKSWAMRIARRAGLRKAKVPSVGWDLARVIPHSATLHAGDKNATRHSNVSTLYPFSSRRKISSSCSRSR
jgi:hypothetical protein